MPEGWTLENDNELANFLKNNINIQGPGYLKNVIRAINVFSFQDEDSVNNLLTHDRRTYWESNRFVDTSENNYKTIRLLLKPNIIIRKLFTLT